MASIDRRNLLRTSATAMAALTAGPALAQAAGDGKPAAPPSAAPKGPPPVPVTHILARYAATAPAEEIPDPVRKEATRTLLNWVCPPRRPRLRPRTPSQRRPKAGVVPAGGCRGRRPRP